MHKTIGFGREKPSTKKVDLAPEMEITERLTWDRTIEYY